jgi:hypothetical protein
MTRLALAAVLLLASASAAPLPAQHPAHGHAAAADAARPAHGPALDRELEAVRAATARYRDHRAAEADGFRRFGREGALMGEHWYRPELVRRPLELARPSTLQYATVAGERVLVGVAYTLYQRPGEPLPAGFAGDADRWHVHDVVRIARMLTEGRPVLRWASERRIRAGKAGAVDGRIRLAMVHAWVWLDNPQGVFAQEHTALPYLRAGLPASWAEPGGVDAAWGVALLDAATCGQETRRVEMLARPGREVEREVRRACEAAAEEVRRERAAGAGRERLNAAAARAWTGFVRARDGALTPEQRARMAAMVEHDMAGGGHAH